MSSYYYDNTKMSDFQECPRKFAIRHIWDLVPNNKSMPLYFGEFMHDCLSKWYETGDEEQALAIWEEYEDNQWDEKRTKSKGIDIFKEYVKTYPTEPFKILANELPFEVLIKREYGHEFYLTGKIDLVVEWHGGNKYILDHKTSSRLGSTYFKQFKPGRQMLGYCFATQELLDIDITGAFINALAVYKSKFAFERGLVSFTPRDFAEYIFIIPRIMQEMAVAERNYAHDVEVFDNYSPWDIMNSHFLPNWDSCFNWGGCPYRDICKSHGAKSVIDAGYREEHWDPREEFKKDD